MSHHFHISVYDAARADSVHVLELVIPDTIEAAEFDAINLALTEQIIARGKSPWIVDLAQTKYTGSALLGLLINIRTTVRTAGGQMMLCAVDQYVQSVIRLSSLDRLFRISPSRAEAAGQFG